MDRASVDPRAQMGALQDPREDPQKGEVDYLWQGLTRTGHDRQLNYSGWFGMELAYLMGAAPIVLCGCPASPRRRFFDEPARMVHSYDASADISASA